MLRSWLIALFCLGCSGHTTLQLTDGDEREGRLVRASPEALFLASEDAATQNVRVERAQVVEALGVGTWALSDGTRVHGDLESEDAEGYNVEVLIAEAIPRSDVEAVEHPGYGVAVTGTVMASVGIGAVVWGWLLTGSFSSGGSFQAAGQGLGLFIVGVGLTAAGIPMAAWGWSVWHRSRLLTGSEDAQAFGVELRW